MRAQNGVSWRHLGAVWAAGCTLGLGGAASAQQLIRAEDAAAVAPEDAKVSNLPEVTVKSNVPTETATSPITGYRAKNAVTATKTDTPVLETPQSVNVVTHDEMVDQGATSLTGALGYAAGVRNYAWGLDSRDDGILVRGGEPSIYLDGVQQYTSGWYTATTRPDPYTLERIEVLRGPAGMLFGAGKASGVVNMVSKRPQPVAEREVGVQFGSFGRKQIQTDLTGPLTESGDWSYRLIALRRSSGTQVHYVPDDRSVLAPSLAWRPNQDTSLILQAYWQKDKTGSTSQFFPWNGTILSNPNGRLPPSRFIGEPGDGYDSERRSFGWQFEHAFNDQWTFRQNFRQSRNDNDSHYHYADFWSVVGGWGEDPVGQRLIGRMYDRGLTRTDLTGIDNHLQGAFDTGSIRHRVLLGVDYSYQRQDTRSASSFSTIDAYAPVYGVNAPPDMELTAEPRSTQRNAGLYLQDQIKWNDWTFVAGLRHDRSTAASAGSPSETTSATTRRLGAMYALPNGWVPYASYAESFTPQGGRDAEGHLFQPLRARQLEAGVKYQPEGVPLLFTAAAFHIKEKNNIVSDATNPNYGRQIGVTHKKGVELEVKGTVADNVDLIANYTYIKADDELGGMPNNQAAVWASYRFSVAGLSGFRVGAGVRYTSAFRDKMDGEGPRVPSAALVDLMLAYENTHWRYALNVNNATDKQYFSTCLSRGDCWWGPRRNVLATVTYKF